MQEVKGSTPTGGTCLNNFSDLVRLQYPYTVCPELDNSGSKVVVVIAVSLNIGGGVCLIKLAKLYMCMQKYYKHKRTDAQWGVCMVMVPYH